jgi:hypothetical protein
MWNTDEIHPERLWHVRQGNDLEALEDVHHSGVGSDQGALLRFTQGKIQTVVNSDAELR